MRKFLGRQEDKGRCYRYNEEFLDVFRARREVEGALCRGEKVVDESKDSGIKTRQGK